MHCLLSACFINLGSLFVDYLSSFRHVVVLCRLYRHIVIKPKILHPTINLKESTIINYNHGEFPKSHREFPRGERRFSLIYLQRGGYIPSYLFLSLIYSQSFILPYLFLYLPLCNSYSIPL